MTQQGSAAFGYILEPMMTEQSGPLIHAGYTGGIDTLVQSPVACLPFADELFADESIVIGVSARRVRLVIGIARPRGAVAGATMIFDPRI